MNLTEQLDSGMDTNMSITNESKGFLLTSCKWAKFLAIIGFVFLTLFVLASFFIGFAGSNLARSPFQGMGILFMFLYLLITAFYFFPTLFLYRFAAKTKEGLEKSSTDLITEGFENLKSCFKFLGVSMAIVIGFYLLIFVVGLLGAAV